MAHSDLSKEYHTLAAALDYGLTRHGDTALAPDFAEALIRASAKDDSPEQENNRQDEEAIAEYIASLPQHELLRPYQNNVIEMLAISRLSDEDLRQRGFHRQSITTTLSEYNKDFLEKQRLAQRAPVLGA